ncbi:MAG: AAA family ATPase [Pseudonocardiaceae bacterium]
MARLLLINGLPGSGKSTLARRYGDEHPLSLCLDIDVVRGLLGSWKDQPSEAGLLARRLAAAMARVALGEGRDVVVPQFLARPGFIEELQVLADELGVKFVEVVLLEEPDRAARRLAQHDQPCCDDPQHPPLTKWGQFRLPVAASASMTAGCSSSNTDAPARQASRDRNSAASGANSTRAHSTSGVVMAR